MSLLVQLNELTVESNAQYVCGFTSDITRYYICVSNFDSDTVSVFNSLNYGLVDTLSVGSNPRGINSGTFRLNNGINTTILLVANNGNDSISVFYSNAGIILLTTIDLGVSASPSQLVVDNRYVWVSSPGINGISRIDPSNNFSVTNFSNICTSSDAIVSNGTYVYVGGTSSIVRFNISTSSVDVTNNSYTAFHLFIGKNYLYGTGTTGQYSNTITIFDLNTLDAIKTITFIGTGAMVYSITGDSKNLYASVYDQDNGNNLYQLDFNLNKLQQIHLSLYTTVRGLILYNYYLYAVEHSLDVVQSNDKVSVINYYHWVNRNQGLDLPTGVVIDPTNSYLYVTNNVNNSYISRYSMTNPTTDYNGRWLNNVRQPYAIVVDKTNTNVYYSSVDNSGISQIRYCKTIANPSATDTLLKKYSGVLTVKSLAIDNTYLYAGLDNGNIDRIRLSDGNYTQNWVTGLEESCVAMTIDKTNTYMYVLLVFGQGIIMKISITNPTTDRSVFFSSLTGFGSATALGLVIDSTNTYLYYSNFGSANINTGNIYQIKMEYPSEFNRKIYSTANSTGIYRPLGMIIDSTDTYMYVTSYINLSTTGPGTIPGGTIVRLELPTPPCFLAGTRILTDEGYIQIQHLRKGDRIQTLLHGFVPIDIIGFRQIIHSAKKERVKQQLYKYSTVKIPELFEDLVLTGCHSILVDEFTSTEQRDKTQELLGDIYITDDKYRLPACLDENAEVFETPGEYTIYHFALENDDYYMNYGVFANGLLVESSSKRYIKELSDMKLLL